MEEYIYVYEVAWDALEKYAEKNSICLNRGLKSDFLKRCTNLHNNLIKDYMKKKFGTHSNDIQLDRHKLAAIVAVCLSSGKYILSPQEKNSKIYIRRYLIALYIAFALVETDMNADLQASKQVKEDEYIALCIPDPVICDTKGAKSIARILIWEEEKKVDSCIRVLELANTLFLIEQYTLLINDINIEDWKEYRKND